MSEDAAATTATTTADANFARLLDEPLRDARGSAAFVFIDEAGRTKQVVTYDRLDRLVAAVAGGLRERGVGRDGRVVMALPPSIELVLTMLATWRIGAALTRVNPGSPLPWVEHVLRAVDADALLLDGREALRMARSRTVRSTESVISLGKRRMPGTISFADLVSTPQARHVDEPVRVGAEDVAVLAPPADMDSAPEPRTHGGLRSRHEAMRLVWPELKRGLMWTTIPEASLQALSRGIATVVPPPRPARSREKSVHRTHRLIAASGATVLLADPVAMAAIAHAPGRAQLSNVLFAGTGGSQGTPELVESLRAVLPNASIATVYGSREAGAIGAAMADDVLAHRSTLQQEGGIYVGSIAPTIDTRIVRVLDGPIEVAEGGILADWEQAPGTAGELLVAAVAGEWQPDDPDIVLDEDGRAWRRTRHIVRRGSDGAVWLLGRRGEGWNVAGKRMWALQLETPATDLPQIERAAVCMPKFAGKDREFKNASAVLVVQPARGYEKDDARRAAEQSLRHRGLDVAVEVRALSKIPMRSNDPTKVDVAALHHKLRPENTEDY